MRYVIAAHLLIGLPAALLSNRFLSLITCGFVALVACQTSLLGMWSVLGRQHWPWRLVGLAAGATYLFVLLGAGVSELRPPTFIFILAVVTLAAAPSVLVRHWENVVVDPGQRTEQRPLLRFSIAQLMWFTFVVASLLAAGRIMLPLVRHYPYIGRIALLGFACGIVSVPSLWATLSVVAPVWRSLAVILLGLSAGAAAAYSLTATGLAPFWAGVGGTHALLLIASLWPLRRAGYRFVTG